jgi:hypothetical protein
LSQAPIVHLDDYFASPNVRARLNTLLLLAEVARTCLKDLRRKLPEHWQEVVRILAKITTEELESVTSTSDAPQIWKQALENHRIVKLQSGRSILERASERLSAASGHGDQSLTYLHEANCAAVTWIRNLGKQTAVTGLANVSITPVRIYYDPAGSAFCASSSRIAGEIGWKLQLKKHAFYGALVPHLLFAHEYISHLLPTSGSLSCAVREVWLIAALDIGQRNASMPAEERQLEAFLWQKFRRELERSFDKTDYGFYGPPGLDAVAWFICSAAPALFWELTSDILSLSRDSDAQLVDRLFERLTDLKLADLRSLISRKFSGLEEFYGAASSY